MFEFDTLLFDLDGTLVDSTTDLTTSVNLLRQEHGLPPLDTSTVASHVGDGTSMLLRRCLPQNWYREQHLNRFLEIYSDHLAEATTPFPGIVPLLQAFQGHAMAVVTNKPLQPTMALLDQLDLRRFFPVVIGGDSMPRKKPDPEPVFAALKQLDRKARRAIMIGDHANDLLAGHAAGTLTCFCCWGTGDHRGIERDFEVKTPAALQQILQLSASQ